MKLRLHPDSTWPCSYTFQERIIPSESSARPWKIQCSNSKIFLSSGDFKIEVSAVAPGIVKCEEVSSRAFPRSGGVVLDNNFEDAASTVIHTKDGAELNTGNWCFRCQPDGSISWGETGKAPALELNGFSFGSSGKEFSAVFHLLPEESVFGCGGRTGSVNRRGKTCDFYAIKVAGNYRGDYGGFPMPFVMTSRGAGLFLDNPWPHVYADFGYEQPDRMVWYAPDGPFRWYFLAGPRPVDILRNWHLLTGRPVLPPEWYFGIWFSWCGHVSEEVWEQHLKRFREEHFPVDALVLDLFWRGAKLLDGNEGGEGSGLDWSRKFGDGRKLIEHAEQMNIHVGLHVNTRMFSGKAAVQGLKEGWLRREQEQVVIDVPDETMAEKAWAVYSPRVDDGCSFWWTDNGERVDGMLGNGLPSRNLFGAHWNEFLFQQMGKMGRKGRLTLSRGDWVGAQRRCIPWPGDTAPGVDRHDEDIRFLLNASISGMPFPGTDLGGFFDDGAVLQDQNFIRRVIHSFLFQPIARIHGCALKLPWNVSERCRELWKTYANIRYRLLPYLMTAAVDAVSRSIPVVRPLWFDFPEDPRCQYCEDELFFGASLLIAPIIQSDVWERRVYLPSGSYYHYWSGKRFEGNREYIVDAPLLEHDGLPVFVKAGAVLAYGGECESVPETEPSEIWLDWYLGGIDSGKICWRENLSPILTWTASDDCLTLQNGDSERKIHWQDNAGEQCCTLAPRETKTIEYCQTENHIIPAPLRANP